MMMLLISISSISSYPLHDVCFDENGRGIECLVEWKFNNVTIGNNTITWWSKGEMNNLSGFNFSFFEGKMDGLFSFNPSQEDIEYLKYWWNEGNGRGIYDDLCFIEGRGVKCFQYY